MADTGANDAAVPATPDDDDIGIIEDNPTPAEQEEAKGRWRLLVIDDEQEVHASTAFSLKDVTVLGRRFALTHARSAAEARQILMQRQDFAVMLVDVVMEADDSGLELVRWIREELRLSSVRIILRTGQPGYAPESVVIQNYDINDYRAKSELTHLRLVTTMTVALRSYQQIQLIEESQKGLVKVVEAATQMFRRHRPHDAEAQMDPPTFLRNLESLLARVSQELDEAAALQRALLPSDRALATLREDHHLAVDFHFEPSSELGGDFLAVTPVDGDKVAFCVCDFAGHGVGAAMNTFRLHTLLGSVDRAELADPSAILALLNRELCSLMTNGNYATAIYGVLDLAANRLLYASAGGPNPVYGSGATGRQQMLDGSGLPLGMIGNYTYPCHEAAFHSGDFLFLYSDAISDATVDDARLGNQGVLDLVSGAVANRPARTSPLQDILATFKKSQQGAQGDDLTALWIERLG